MFTKKFKYSLIRTIASPWLPMLVRFYTRLLKIETSGEERVRRMLESGRRVILCCLHQQLFVGICHFPQYAAYRPPIMISSSADGDIVSDLLRRLGGSPVRGSSSRDGSRALLAMIDAVRQAKLGIHVVDGPRGPHGQVKGGLIQLAQATSASIVPFIVEPEKAWHFKSWDRFFIPKPLSTVRLRMLDPIAVEKNLSDEAFERLRLKVEGVFARETAPKTENGAKTNA